MLRLDGFLGVSLSIVQVTSENIALNKDSLALGSSINLISVDHGWGSAWYEESVSLLSDWSTSFSFTAGGGSGTSDGFTFAINGDSKGLEAIGDGGGNLGFFGLDTGVGIQDSFAILFDMWVKGPESLVGFSESANTYFPQGDLNSTTPLLNNIYDVEIFYDSIAKSLNVEIGSQVFSCDIDLSQVVGESAYLGFSAANGGGTMDMTVQEWFIESSPVGDSGPITGTFDGPGKVKLNKAKLKNRGKVSFRLYGSEDIDLNASHFDRILFGGDSEALMSGAPDADAFFKGAKRKKGKKAGFYRAKVKDINGDGFDDIKIKALKRDIVGVMKKGDTKIFAYAQMGEESVLWSNADTVFF